MHAVGPSKEVVSAAFGSSNSMAAGGGAVLNRSLTKRGIVVKNEQG